MLSLLVAVAVLHTQGPVSLAVPGFQAVNIGQPEADLYAELAAQELTMRGIKVLTARDIGSVLGLERQRQLLGCTETSCITEIAGGLGADGLMVGDVGRIGSEYVLTVKVLNTSTGTPLALFNDKAVRAELMPQVVKRAMWNITKQLSQALRRGELYPPDVEPLTAEAPAAPPRPSKWLSLAFGGPGLAALALGGVMQGMAGGSFTSLQGATLLTDAERFHAAGVTQQTVAQVGFIAGGVLVAAAVVWFIVFAGEPTPAAAWLPDVSSAGLTWRLP